MPAVSGHVSYRGRGEPDAQVLLADADARRLLGQARTDGAGGFVLECRDPVPDALVLAKCADGAVGLAVARTPVPASETLRLRLEDRGPLWPLEVEVAGQDLPDELELTLMPWTLDAVPDEWLHLIWMPVEDVVYGGFAALPVRGSARTVAVQAGAWLVAAQRLVAAAAASPDVEPPASWVTVAVEVDGHPVERGPQGFLVAVRGPTSVRLRVEAVRPSA
jgi:hypothetical protein